MICAFSYALILKKKSEKYHPGRDWKMLYWMSTLPSAAALPLPLPQGRGVLTTLPSAGGLPRNGRKLPPLSANIRSAKRFGFWGAAVSGN